MRVVLVLLLLPLASGQGIFMTDEMTATTNAGTTSYTMQPFAAPEVDSKAYTATGLGALAYTTAFEYSVGEPFTPEGTVAATAFLSCDAQTVLRPGAAGQATTARMEFVKDGAVLATVNLESLRTCDGPSDVWEAVFETDALAGTAFGAGSTMTLNLIVWVPTGNPGSGLENMYVLVGPTFPSGLVGAGLPARAAAEPPAEPAIVSETFTQGFEHSWASPRNGTFLLNTTLDAPMEMTLNATADAGSGRLVVTDANQTVVFDDALSNQTVLLDGAVGNWTFNVTYDGFVGNVSVQLAQPDQDNPAAAPGETEANAPDQNGTGAPDSGGDDAGGEDSGSAGEDAPGLGLLAMFGALAVALRRRA